MLTRRAGTRATPLPILWKRFSVAEPDRTDSRDSSCRSRPFRRLGRHPAFQELVRTLSRDETQPPLAFGSDDHRESSLSRCCCGRRRSGPLIVVVDGNKQAEALIGARRHVLQPAGAGRDAQRPATASGARCAAARRTCRRTPRSASSAPSACGGSPPGGADHDCSRSPRRCCASSPRDFYRQLALTLRVGDELPLEDVIAHLESIGYERREPVEMVGEYSVRGGILDVFSAGIAEAGAHRSLRRPGRIHPALRCGVAAVRAEGRRRARCCR